MWKDWNYERYRTRDRLIEYSLNIYPTAPHSAGLPVLYPWENLILKQLENELLNIAKKYGYTDTVENFWKRFSNGNLYKGILENFPVPGDEQNLYLDTNTGVVYYFKRTASTLSIEFLNKIDAIIAGQSIDEDTQETETFLYIPVKAYLMEDMIFDCGDAAEYID